MKYKIKVEKLLFLFPRRSLPYLKVVQKSEMSKEKSKTFIDKCDSVTSVTTFFSLSTLPHIIGLFYIYNILYI